VTKENDEKTRIVTDEELEALFRGNPALQLSSYGEALAFKTRLFKRYFVVTSVLAVMYVGAFSAGIIDPYLAAGWSGMPEHRELQKLRFVSGFIMLVVLHVWLLLGQRLEVMLMSFASVLTYFQFSGAANLSAFEGPTSNLGFVAGYVLSQSSFIVLLLLLIREERRPFRPDSMH
jgi:hypothetical protein